MTFMEDMRMMAEDMVEKEREEFLAMAEEIDRFEDELEQQKLIILSDCRKKLGNKNYPDLDDFLLRNARIKLSRLYPSK
jgi:hypothetical protein